MNKTLGMILIALGLVGLMWGGFSYETREKVADIRPLDITITRSETHSLPLPPIFGAVALIGGIVLLVTDKQGMSSAR